MDKVQAQVYEMMKVLDIPLPNQKGPGVKGLDCELLRCLVLEEAHEYHQAMWKLQGAIAFSPEDRNRVMGAWAEVIDAMCDILVVVHNTSNAMGLDLEPFVDEVHRTNLAKVGGDKNEYGKVMKPPGWEPPRIREMLEELISR